MKRETLLVKHKIKTGLISDIRQLIESARSRAAVAVNVELTLLYWRVGERIRREILKSQRAESSMMFERTAISKKPDTIIKMELVSLREEGKLTPDIVFRDPYFLS